MKLSRLAKTFALASFGYITYAYGFWEPLRTVVIGALCTSVAIAALLRHRTRIHRDDTGYLQIAFLAIAVGVGTTGFAVDRLVATSVASVLGPVLFTAAAGFAGVALTLIASSRTTSRSDADVIEPPEVNPLLRRD